MLPYQLKLLQHEILRQIEQNDGKLFFNTMQNLISDSNTVDIQTACNILDTDSCIHAIFNQEKSDWLYEMKARGRQFLTSEKLKSEYEIGKLEFETAASSILASNATTTLAENQKIFNNKIRSLTKIATCVVIAQSLIFIYQAVQMREQNRLVKEANNIAREALGKLSETRISSDRALLDTLNNTDTVSVKNFK